MAIKRAEDLIPKEILTELQRLAKLEGPLIHMKTPMDDTGRIELTLLKKTWLPLETGSDRLSAAATVEWLRDSPKVARPTREQEESLGRVDIPLTLAEFSAPFPAMFVETPNSQVHKGVLVARISNTLILLTKSYSGEYDISTQLSSEKHTLEETFTRYDDRDDWSDVDRDELLRVQRVALNFCLLLSNHPLRVGPILLREVERDRRLATDGGERGERARERIARAIHEVTFEREVIVRRTLPASKENGEPTGRTIASHWVRGHWKMQCHGPNNSLRRRQLIPPYLTHKDQYLGGEVSTYKVQ